jgi:hypothetical protein
VASTTWKEPDMTQHIDSRSRQRDGMHDTAHAVAAGHDAYLHEALDSVSWERRGLLGRLMRGPREEHSQESES